MNIAVLVKQVPGTTNVEIDPVTGTLRRDGVAAKMNPYDLFSLEEALKLHEKEGGKLIAVTMGPNQAASVIREAVYMGCDHGYVVSDRKFAGADVLATSRTLSGALKKIAQLEGIPAFDLILCGKQTTDGDTAQVGPEAAERLSVPHVANILKIEAVERNSVTVLANMGDYEQKLKLPLPSLLTIEKDVNTPRLPSIKRKYALSETDTNDLVKFISLADFDDSDPKKYGLNGSPTQVERVFPPESNTEQKVYTGTGSELAGVLYGQLKDLKVL